MTTIVPHEKESYFYYTQKNGKERTDRIARRWRFSRDYPALNAKKGDLLYEDDNGFHTRNKDGDVDSWNDVEEWQVKPLLVELGEPPFAAVVEQYREAESLMVQAAEAIFRLARHAPSLVSMLSTAFEDRLDELEKEPPSVEWFGTIEEAVEREIAAVGTSAPAHREPWGEGLPGRTWKVSDGRRQRQAIRYRVGTRCPDCGAYREWTGRAERRCGGCNAIREAEKAERAKGKPCADCGKLFPRRGRATRCVECRRARIK